jgi:hypothetical protein
MYDMLLMAFQTDSTCVATLLLGHDGDNRSFSDIGIPEGHHDLSHHQNKSERIEKVARIDLWYAEQFAVFLKKLQDTKDVDGNSLLHNSMVLYGSGNADGNRHTHSNLPLILAGAGGGAGGAAAAGADDGAGAGGGRGDGGASEIGSELMNVSGRNEGFMAGSYSLPPADW